MIKFGHYRDAADLAEVVRRFETCEFANTEFVHAAHLGVAVAYLSELPLEEAMARMRAALVGFSRHHGRMGYHETITRFWLVLVSQFLRAHCAGLPAFEAANRVVAEYADKKLLFTYYSRDFVMSDEARARWVEPDLLPLTSAREAQGLVDA